MKALVMLCTVLALEMISARNSIASLLWGRLLFNVGQLDFKVPDHTDVVRETDHVVMCAPPITAEVAHIAKP